MNRIASAAWIVLLMLPFAELGAVEGQDPLDVLERQEQDDLERLRNVNSGEVEFLNDAAADADLHTDMHLNLAAEGLPQGWVDMRQCQRGLDAMASSEIVYRYAEMRDLRVTGVRGIDSARVEDQSIQLRGVQADAEVCVAARVKILRDLGDGRYRLVSGPYHRRFFDGYFPMRLSLEVRYPAEAMQWRRVTPAAQPGFLVREEPGRLTIDTRFTGMLTVELEFARRE